MLAWGGVGMGSLIKIVGLKFSSRIGLENYYHESCPLSVQVLSLPDEAGLLEHPHIPVLRTDQAADPSRRPQVPPEAARAVLISGWS